MEDVCCMTIQCNVNIRRAVGIVPTISGCNYIFCLHAIEKTSVSGQFAFH